MIKTYEEVSARLHYNPDNGEIIWISPPSTLREGGRIYNSWCSRCLNKRAGHVHKKKTDKTSYRSLRFEGETLKEHRVAILLQTGQWPTKMVDHINGDGTDNRWENLREVDNSVSSKNMPMKSTNTSGVVGVNKVVSTDKWRAVIGHCGRNYHLGNYTDVFEAICARKSAERRYDFHENHGRNLSSDNLESKE